MNEKRPIFLTVLCILSFAGSVMLVISSTAVYLVAISEIGMASDMSNDAFLKTTDYIGYLNYAKISSILLFISAIATFVGAFMMWRLKKPGYYIYVPAEIVPAITSGIGLGIYIMDGISGTFQIGGFVFNLLISIAFIVMYGLNLKHMH